jgi:hypothetical protein
LGTIALPLSIFLELGLDHGKKSLINNRRDFDEDLTIDSCVDARNRPPGMLWTTTLSSKLLGFEWSGTGLAESRRPLEGRILEDRPNHRAIPGGLPGPSRHPLAVQAAADFADGTPVLADPREDLLDHPRLICHDLIARLAVSVVLADIAMSVGRATEHVDRATPGGVLLASPTPLEDLGPLVFGDHALHLDQEVLRGVMPEGIAEEDDLDAAMSEFLQDEDLTGILARESIRVEDVEAVDGAGGRLIPEPLQARTDQRAPAAAVVHEMQLGIACQSVVGDAPGNGREWAGDGVLLGLLFRRDSSIDRHAETRCRHDGSSSCARGSGEVGSSRSRRVAPWTLLLGSRTSCDDGRQGFIGRSDDLLLEPRELEVTADGSTGRMPPLR